MQNHIFICATICTNKISTTVCKWFLNLSEVSEKETAQERQRKVIFYIDRFHKCLCPHYVDTDTHTKSSFAQSADAECGKTERNPFSPKSDSF